MPGPWSSTISNVKSAGRPRVLEEITCPRTARQAVPDGESWAPTMPLGCVMPSFQLVGLPFELFSGYFSLSDSELRDLCMQRVVATEQPGFPCRVSLSGAAVGEELLLLPYVHQPEDSPYRASGPIFVRKCAEQRVMEPGVVPDYVRLRLMSVRAYDASH